MSSFAVAEQAAQTAVAKYLVLWGIKSSDRYEVQAFSLAHRGRGLPLIGHWGDQRVSFERAKFCSPVSESKGSLGIALLISILNSCSTRIEAGIEMWALGKLKSWWVRVLVLSLPLCHFLNLWVTLHWRTGSWKRGAGVWWNPHNRLWGHDWTCSKPNIQAAERDAGNQQIPSTAHLVTSSSKSYDSQGWRRKPLWVFPFFSGNLSKTF